MGKFRRTRRKPGYSLPFLLARCKKRPNDEVVIKGHGTGSSAPLLAARPRGLSWVRSCIQMVHWLPADTVRQCLAAAACVAEGPARRGRGMVPVPPRHAKGEGSLRGSRMRPKHSQWGGRSEVGGRLLHISETPFRERGTNALAIARLVGVALSNCPRRESCDGGNKGNRYWLPSMQTGGGSIQIRS